MSQTIGHIIIFLTDTVNSIRSGVVKRFYNLQKMSLIPTFCFRNIIGIKLYIDIFLLSDQFPKKKFISF